MAALLASNQSLLVAMLGEPGFALNIVAKVVLFVGMLAMAGEIAIRSPGAVRFRRLLAT